MNSGTPPVSSNNSEKLCPKIADLLARGAVIPAHPLALTSERRFDERHQRALTRYYVAAGAGGVAIGVHTTQFAIREPRYGLYHPLLELTAEELNRADRTRPEPMIRIGGIVGETNLAVREAGLLRDLKYHAGLLSLSSLKGQDNEALLAHCRAVAEVIPIVGFYLQPAAGGIELSECFWREFVQIENVAAIKVAPFNRYRTLIVMRAVAESGRSIPIFTGNDDNIVIDLVTPYTFQVNGQQREVRMVGGLLGHWAVWTRAAVDLLRDCRQAAGAEGGVTQEILRRSVEVTDANSALFDAANGFAGSVAGVHEVLRRQGLLDGIWCLDPKETLGPGQKEEIDRVYAAYPHLNDDQFVREGLDSWLTP